MKLISLLSDTTRARRSAATLAALVALLSTGLLLPLDGADAATTVPLGTAESFALLAGQSVTNTGSTIITGDIGIHPGAAESNVTGYDSIVHTGTLYDGDGVALKAKADLVTAYDDAEGRDVTQTIAAGLDGQNLGPGVYESPGGGAFLLGDGGTLTLTGGQDDVWIFQSGSTLDFNSGSSVVLIGADPCNVFWQVTSSATLETNSSVVGTIMALTSISLRTGATLEGSALARNGSVTMDTNTITNSVCTADNGNGDDNGNDNGTGGGTGTDNGTGGGTGTDNGTGGGTGTDNGTGGGTGTDNGTDAGTGTDNGDDTSSDGDTTGAGGTPSDGDTTGQVGEVPSGAVAAGEGPADGFGGTSLLIARVLVLLALASSVGIAAQRRVRVQRV